LSGPHQKALCRWQSHSNYRGYRARRLTEVVSKQGRYRKCAEHLKGANAQANPELLRMKMATGRGRCRSGLVRMCTAETLSHYQVQMRTIATALSWSPSCDSFNGRLRD